MKMLLIGLLAGFVGGISASGWAHFRNGETPSLDIQELHAQVQEMDSRMERGMSILLAEMRGAQQRTPSRQEIHDIVMHAVHGCHVVGYLNANMYTIECPIR